MSKIKLFKIAGIDVQLAESSFDERNKYIDINSYTKEYLKVEDYCASKNNPDIHLLTRSFCDASILTALIYDALKKTNKASDYNIKPNQIIISRWSDTKPTYISFEEMSHLLTQLASDITVDEIQAKQKDMLAQPPRNDDEKQARAIFHQILEDLRTSPEDEIPTKKGANNTLTDYNSLTNEDKLLVNCKVILFEINQRSMEEQGRGEGNKVRDIPILQDMFANQIDDLRPKKDALLSKMQAAEEAIYYFQLDADHFLEKLDPLPPIPTRVEVETKRDLGLLEKLKDKPDSKLAALLKRKHGIDENPNAPQQGFNR